MITLVEFSHTLTKVGVHAQVCIKHCTPAHARNLRDDLKGVVWMLSEDMQAVDTPARKEARRMLRIETEALLAEIEMALREPTSANQSAVCHRARAWNLLLRRFRQSLGIETMAAALRRARAAAARPAGRQGLT